MKTPRIFLSLLASAAFVVASNLNAATTDPVGYMTLTVKGAVDGSEPAFTQLSAPLQEGVITAGTLSETPTSAVATNSSASYTVNEYASTDSVGNSEYYIQFTTGSSAGLILNIVSNDATSLTTHADLSGHVSSGDAYVIKKHTTLADIFGLENSAGLKSGGDSSSSDLVYIMSSDGAGVYANYYYQTDPFGGAAGGDGWRAVGDSNTDVSDVVVGPDDGLIVSRTGTADLSFTITGSVNTSDHLRGLPNGYSLVSYPYPLDVSLDDSGIYSESNGYVSGGDSSTSDLVYILKANGTFDIYYRQTDPFGGAAGGDGWRTVGDSNTDIGATTIIPSGSSMIVFHRGTGLQWADAKPF